MGCGNFYFDIYWIGAKSMQLDKTWVGPIFYIIWSQPTLNKQHQTSIVRIEFFSSNSDINMVANLLVKQAIEHSYQEILSVVRSSRLNFAIQETPFSFYFTVRKSFNKSSDGLSFQRVSTSRVENEQDSVQSKIKVLEEANEILRKDYEEALLETETLTKENECLENKLVILSDKLTESKDNIDTIVARKVKAISDEKRSLQIKHERVAADLKYVKNENDDAQKHIKNLEVALKSSQKEIKEVVGTHNKKISGFEIRINDLQNYKIDKMSEERELKTKIKKVDKKLKQAGLSRATLEINYRRFLLSVLPFPFPSFFLPSSAQFLLGTNGS